MTPLQNLPRNVGDLGKLISAKGFKKLPRVQKIAKSGHTDRAKAAPWRVEQCDQTDRLSFDIWPLTTMEIGIKICQSELKMLPKTK